MIRHPERVVLCYFIFVLGVFVVSWGPIRAAICCIVAHVHVFCLVVELATPHILPTVGIAYCQRLAGCTVLFIFPHSGFRGLEEADKGSH